MPAGERGVFDSLEVADVNIREASAKGASFSSFGTRHNAARCASQLLLGLPQEVVKKGTKGSNTLWKPAVRKGRDAVAPLIFSQRLTSSAFAFAS